MDDDDPPWDDDDPPRGDIIWPDGANGNIADSTVSAPGDSILPTPPFLSTPPPFLPTPLAQPSSLLNRRKNVERLPHGGTPFPIVSDMRARRPGTSFLQHRMAKFTTVRPEESVTRSDTTESGMRNRILALWDFESEAQIGRAPTNIGDYDLARGILSATNAASIYFRYNRR